MIIIDLIFIFIEVQLKMKNHLQICFLPWFKINEIIKIGTITFWPYYVNDIKKTLILQSKNT